MNMIYLICEEFGLIHLVRMGEMGSFLLNFNEIKIEIINKKKKA